jgi:hypothetical protein
LAWKSHETRLRVLARQRGVCPRHPRERLSCGACDWAWTGTEDEADELVRLIAPIAPYADRIPPQGRCRCGQAMHCASCWTAAARHIQVSGAVATDFGEAECRRYHELMARFQRKEPYALPDTPRPS